MSISRHPVALKLEELVGGSTALLATVMGLPLVDGIFPALVLAGALDGPVGILQVGLLVFGGSATLAVIVAEMETDPRSQARDVLLVGVALVAVAAVESALAPTIASLLDLAVFQRFAALVILTVAAKTASARIGEYLPSPAVIIGLGAVASVQPNGVEFVVTPDPWLVVQGAAAAGVGVAFALAVVGLQSQLARFLDIDRFRFGSATALGVLSLSVAGLVPSDAPLPLAVLGIAAVLAFNPQGSVRDAVESRSSAATDGGAAGDEDESETRTEERAPWL